MEGEAGEVGIIVSIVHTCGWEGAASSRRCGLGLGSATVAATWRFPELGLSWEGPRCGAL